MFERNKNMIKKMVNVTMATKLHQNWIKFELIGKIMNVNKFYGISYKLLYSEERNMSSITNNTEETCKQNYQKTIQQNEQTFQALDIKENEGLWVFGYGSLIWYVNFDYDDVKTGTINAYKRRFWQQSTDHRGTHEKPGRVVTLIKGAENDELWGKAYYVTPEKVRQTLDILNFREKGGYSLIKVPFTPRNPKSSDNSTAEEILQVILYVGIEGNVDYIGEETLDDTALRIAESIGPSGPNVFYLSKLAEALEENNFVSDDDLNHTIEIWNRVQKILQEKNVNS